MVDVFEEGRSLDRAGPLVTAVREQWDAAGRARTPHVVCQVNVAVGSSDIIKTAREAIANYYAFTGRSDWGAPISDPHEIRDLLAGYRELGADELVLYCYADDPNQVDELATAVL